MGNRGWDDDFEVADEFGNENIVDKPTLAEIRAAAEVVVLLEEMHVDVKRIRVRVRNGVVSLQGSVESDEKRIEVEETLLRQPQIREVENHLMVHET